MLKRILLGLGGTEYTPCAVRYAVDIAQRHGASVTGVTVVDLAGLDRVGPVPAGAGRWAKDLREHRVKVACEHVSHAVEEFVRACDAAGISFQLLREEGSAFDLMISDARYHDLTIFGLRSLFEYDFVADPCETLVRLVSHGVRPILAVAPEYRDVRRVLVAYSGSTESAKSMRRFAQLRLWPDAQWRIAEPMASTSRRTS